LAVLTVGAGAATPLTVGGESPIAEVAVTTDRRVTLIEREDAGGGQADLSTAPAVVGVGLGVSDQADLAQLEALAKLLGGGVSCSRGVCEERGWFDQYIGVSGLNLSPDLYLAIGISGQIQHLYGVREAKLIAAVNINKDAPIFRNADYGIVGDYRTVVPRLIAALSGPAA
jgi:electron transfer flavoprotein alpha subunit